MIINRETAEYMLAVVKKLDDGTLSPDAIRTNECPECGFLLLQMGEDQGHVVHRDKLGRLVIIVACEDYWVIDPNLVGIPSETWQPLFSVEFPEPEIRGIGG